MKNGIIKKIAGLSLGIAMAIGVGVAVGHKGVAREAKAATSGTVTYAITSKTAVSTSGTAPDGSSASYSTNCSTLKKLDANQSMNFALAGYAGCKITGLTLSMRSLASAGAGLLSFIDGAQTIANINSNKFNAAVWYGAWSTSYVNVSVSPDSALILKEDFASLTISCTTSSIYCQSITVEWSFVSEQPVEKAYKTMAVNQSTPSASVDSYSNTTFDNTFDGFVTTIENGSNYGKKWNLVKLGSKNNSVVANIITKTAIDKAVDKISLSINSITASKVNSIKLYTSSTSTFGDTEVATFTIGAGKKTVELATPTKALYYKIEFDLQQGSANGFVAVSRVDFYAFDAEKYAAYFNSNIGCDVTGETAPTGNWTTLSNKFDLLIASDKNILKNATYTLTGSGEQTVVTPGENVSQEVAQAVSRYDWIVKNRGTTDYPNFMSRTIDSGSGSALISQTITKKDISATIVIIISATSILALGAFLLLKKKKEN